MVFHRNLLTPRGSARRRRVDPLDALDLLGQGKGGAFADLFSLSNPVGPKGANRRVDVVRVESLLGQMGALGSPAESDRFGAFTGPLEKAVRGFQKRKGLKVDGLLNPGGPTLKALIEGLKPTKTAPLPADVFAANARTALALSRTLDPGPLPGYVAEALASGGDKAKAEVADLLEQVAGRFPFMARKLRARVASLVGEKERAVLYGEGLLKRLAGLREGEDEDGGAKPKPPGDQHPDAPEEPDQPDEPDPDEGKKPDPDQCLEEREDAREAYVAVLENRRDILEVEARIDQKEQEIRDLEAGKITPDPNVYGPDPMPDATDAAPPVPGLGRKAFPGYYLLWKLDRARDEGARLYVLRKRIAELRKEIADLEEERKKLEGEKIKLEEVHQRKVKDYQECLAKNQ